MLQVTFFKNHYVKKMFLSLLFFVVIINMTACSSPTSANEEEEMGEYINNLNTIMGGKIVEVKENLNAEEIQQVTEVDKSYYEEVAKMIEGSTGYEKFNEDLLVILKELANDKNNELYGSKQIYVSNIPVFGWDCLENSIAYNGAMLLFFTKDLSKMGACHLVEESTSKFVFSNFGNLDTTYREALTKEPEQEVILIYDADTAFFLNEKNEVIGASVYYNFTVEGDYYQTLAKTGIQVSLEQLVSDSILFEIK